MLFSQRTGSGIPLVFIHAFPLSSQMWEVNKPTLSKNFQLITVDLPGFGKSPLQDDTSHMEAMASQVVATLDQMKLTDKFVIAGLSMGGYVTMQVLKMIPDRIRAAVFLSTRSAPDSPEGRDKRFKTIEAIEEEGIKFIADRMPSTLLGKSTTDAKLPVVAQVKKRIEEADPKAVCAALRGMAARPDMTSVVSALNVPALVIAGEEDVVIPASDMEAMSKKIPNSEFHVIPKSGHLLNLEQPKVFEDYFLHFLKRRVL